MRPSPTTGRLNDFQRTMLHWNRLHPYNSVEVARIDAAISPARFAAAVAHVLEAAGLTNYSVGDGRFGYAGGPVEVVPKLLDGGDALEQVHREMERELNEPFPCGPEPFQPFRWFLANGNGEAFVGLTYFHVAADAHAAGRLLGEVIAACFDGSPRALRDESLVRKSGSRLPMGGPSAIVGEIRQMLAMRQSFRSPPCLADGFRNAWFARSLDAGETTRTLELAKRHGTTVNDLFLAALLDAVAPLATDRLGQGRRNQLSVGCIANLRPEMPERRRDDFGVSLGSFAVTHPVPADMELPGLLADVHRQTTAAKRSQCYLASWIEFRLGNFLFARQRGNKRRNYYRKVYPAWAGLTNLKKDAVEGDGWQAMDYIRAVSTGPALPLVLAVTGYRGRLNFGFIHRPGVIDEEEARGIADRFIASIT
ncbi:MAG TPA: hypothetical protein PLA50_13815 [Bacteroidia bacterium]|nr:hypothetical protein [Bacteroidia bacterium]